MNTNVFSFLSFSVFLQIEREGGYIKLGIRRNGPKVYLSYFDGFLWRIILLRLFFYPEFLALVPSATNPVQQLIFSFPFSADGKKVPLPFQGPSQSFGFYLLPSRVRRPEWGHRVPTSVGLHSDPHSLLWRLSTVNSRTGNSSNLISIFSVGHHVTPFTKKFSCFPMVPTSEKIWSKIIWLWVTLTAFLTYTNWLLLLYLFFVSFKITFFNGL